MDKFSKQIDPISHYPYSFPNDITIFEIENTCFCGEVVDEITAEGIPIAENIEGLSEVILLGYPGRVDEKSYLLKQHLSYEEKNRVQYSLNENQLCWTEGVIICIGDLMGISNSSAAGMSGSPILAFIEGQWKAIAMLLGGPATIGHYHLMKLAATDDVNEFNEIADELIGLAFEIF